MGRLGAQTLGNLFFGTHFLNLRFKGFQMTYSLYFQKICTQSQVFPPKKIISRLRQVTVILIYASGATFYVEYNKKKKIEKYRFQAKICAFKVGNFGRVRAKKRHFLKFKPWNFFLFFPTFIYVSRAIRCVIACIFKNSVRKVRFSRQKKLSRDYGRLR